MKKEQIEKAIDNSYKYTSAGFLIDHDILADKILALSQPTTDLDKKDDLKAAYYDGYDAAKIDELVHNENVNLWRLRYESLLKGLNDVTNELNVYKINKDFDLDELKEQWIKYCTDNKMNGVIKGWNFFLPHLQKPVESEWIKLKDKKPEREPNVKYSNVPCLVIYKRQVCILCFNHEHECWDDKDGDDYCCDIESIEFWQPLPKPPIQTK